MFIDIYDFMKIGYLCISTKNSRFNCIIIKNIYLNHTIIWKLYGNFHRDHISPINLRYKRVTLPKLERKVRVFARTSAAKIKRCSANCGKKLTSSPSNFQI